MKLSKSALVVVVSCLGLVASRGQASPGIGVYFDAGANTTEAQLAPYTPSRIYIVLTDSPVPSVDGLQVAYTIQAFGGGANAFFRLSQELYGATGTVSGDAFAGEYDLTWATPRPAGYALVLVTWDLMITYTGMADISLAEIAVPGVPDDLPEISSAGARFPIPIHLACGGTTGQGYPSAIINYHCGVPVESRPWGGVKSMYR